MLARATNLATYVDSSWVSSFRDTRDDLSVSRDRCQKDWLGYAPSQNALLVKDCALSIAALLDNLANTKIDLQPMGSRQKLEDQQ